MILIFRALFGLNLREGALRSAVAVAAVALGVAVSLAIDLANATAVASFARSVNVVANRVNLQVLGAGSGFDERTLLRVASLPGIVSASPAIEGSFTAGARTDDPFAGEILRVLGVDALQPLPRAPSASRDGFDFDLMVNRHGAIVSERVARRYGLRAGALFEGLAGARPVTLRIAYVLPAGVPGLDSSVVFVDIATAQEIFGKVGRLDRIDCVVAPARLAVTAAALQAVLPPGVRAVEPSTRTGEIDRMLQSFRLNLAALSAIALVVATYLIFNTIAIGVVQRRAEIGTLRALGARRREIFGAFVAEGAMFGVAGSLLGLLFGALLAGFAVAAVQRTVETLYVGAGADRVAWDPVLVLKALAVGIVLAIAAAVGPAVEAARVSPARTMRANGVERLPPYAALRLAAAGVVLTVLGVAASRIPAVDGIPVFGYVAGVAAILAASVLVPPTIELLARLGRSVFRRPPSQLAAANLAAALGRNSVAVAALIVAIGMMTSVAILIESFRTTVVTWADQVLRADLFVRPLGPSDASAEARFSPAVVAALRRLEGVAAVDAVREIAIPYRGRTIALGDPDFASEAQRPKLRLIGVADPRQLALSLRGAMRAVISEPLATRYGIGAGDVLALDTPSGKATFAVAAVYNDYSNDEGTALIDRATFVRLFGDRTVDSIAIYARPGADLTSLRTRVIRSMQPLRVDVETNSELRAVVLRIFNRTFAITYALYVISMVIALLGIVSTLFALVLERRREIAVLRYLGLRTLEVRSMVLVEAAMLGALGALGGLLVGARLGWLLIFVINRQAFGWLIELHVPWTFLAASFVVAVAAAVLSGLYPAQLAARLSTAEALRAE